MTPRPPTDPRIRGYLDGLALAIAEELLRELACARDTTTPVRGETSGAEVNMQEISSDSLRPRT